MASKHFMLLPSLACQAKCAYCFGPNRGPVMKQAAFREAVDWIASCVGEEQEVEITFHGGEPLLAGKAWYRRNLPILQQKFSGRLALGIQSNLWTLDDEFCSIFKENHVSIGTSLDGPEPINDAQRGWGYFRHTMAGIETARRNGIQPGVICTFTRLSWTHYKQVFEFFAGLGLSFSVHEAVCALGTGHKTPLAMTPQEAARLMLELFDTYLENIHRARITTFDSMARGLAAQNGGICTFGDCLGKYLTIGPQGGIYPCNRFAHNPDWQIGSVFEHPTSAKLAESAAWEKLRQRELTVQEDCGSCTHFEYCRGGCPYNAFTSGTDRRDSNCTVYRQLFDHLRERALEEVFSEENLNAVIEHGTGKHGLMRKGPLTQVMKGDVHPQELARKARETVAAAALGCSPSIEEAVEKLDRAGIVTQRETAMESLRSMRQRLDLQSRSILLNAYLHVTMSCNLSCLHCYAQAGPGKSESMQVADAERMVRECASAGFRKVIVTGGEPMSHPERKSLLQRLAELRTGIKPAQIVLRTNLAYPLTEEMARAIAAAADQIVVSVDGDETAHDQRRGVGNYLRTVQNLHLMLDAVPAKTLMLSAVLSPEQMRSAAAESVHRLGQALGIPTRFKSVLPIGRGVELSPSLAYYSSMDESSERMAASLGPSATCGLGMNLYVGPGGECFPCYALMSGRHDLGNALQEGLAAVLGRNDRYRKVTVDSSQGCKQCALRYVCGGFCRAWCTDDDPQSAPRDCTALKSRANELLLAALETLEVSAERWQESGLPIMAKKA